MVTSKKKKQPNAPNPLGKYACSLTATMQGTNRQDIPTVVSQSMSIQPLLTGIKWQATIETRVFDTEFVAMEMGVDTLRGLRYKTELSHQSHRKRNTSVAQNFNLVQVKMNLRQHPGHGQFPPTHLPNLFPIHWPWSLDRPVNELSDVKHGQEP